MDRLHPEIEKLFRAKETARGTSGSGRSDAEDGSPIVARSRSAGADLRVGAVGRDWAQSATPAAKSNASGLSNTGQ